MDFSGKSISALPCAANQQMFHCQQNPDRKPGGFSQQKIKETKKAGSKLLHHTAYRFKIKQGTKRHRSSCVAAQYSLRNGKCHKKGQKTGDNPIEEILDGYGKPVMRNRTAQTAEYIVPQCEKDSMQCRQKKNNRFLPDRRADHRSILRNRLPFVSGLRPE